jgi:phytanoyl-CoA dioxygenase PhyH
MLTDSELARFWEDGFVAVECVFSAAEVEALRRATDDPGIVDDLHKRRADERTVHLIPITTRHDAFKELARDIRLTGRAARLIGDDIQLSNSKLATKPQRQGAGAFDWHQDFAYYTSTNFDLITISVALDDVTPDNGGMYAVRGSHKLGLLDHTTDGWMTGGCVESAHWQERPELVMPLMSRAGGITIHHCLTLHGSPVNNSGLPRRLVIFQYRAGHCYQLADHIWEDSGFQVHGAPSGRVKCAAMDVILPRNRGWERYCGEPHGSVYNQIGARAREWNKEPQRPAVEAAE